MKIFKLPDLGEGLPDAVIREWHVQEGDSVSADQALVTVETAKALVEVPSPFSGTVEKRYAAEGDTLETGQPLVGFVGEETGGAADNETKNKTGEQAQPADSGTVVGKIEQGSEALAVEQRPVTSRPRNATPAVRALARRLGVDLENLHPAGARFTEAEVRAAARGETIPRWTEKTAIGSDSAAKSPEIDVFESTANSSSESSPARRAMTIAMNRARDQVCPMTLFDEVDISDWPKGTSATLRLLKAIAHAASEEPNLNAHFDNEVLVPKTPVNVGLAVDAPKGLFVPVLQDVGAQCEEVLLETIARFKQQAADGAIPQKDLQGATIHLSNFGSLAGRFATPVVVPPLVCIVGAGRSHKAVLPHKGKARVRKLLPLSITADHRAVTGGELARFLKALKDSLKG
ncbi:dihydrolipoamide acetyltransferase family protein [Microbulbifer hydrolyticus]|uniref:Dihydrolipoamide acetyltransferase component of pyruvate dehydrogenase complex n=1 Tax=Microbulbifer hydrolyticus TaxID=48074 RepID=A0A6P1T464_9GAMM|nr:dihydrolipoamide acetyltransferase family protein [Microbulbifer hydrolyticus]MBB5211735.1 pyruvate dehydrogenase E2 component (dihydrolipoamide acetyltransferase) [Microbulbifer hydrolyticus]QHQ37538.1 2-oxo acid dehydrogenase subunit E2 [Microbulbifer hydrolyticus]